MGCQHGVEPIAAPAEPALGRIERLAVRLHDRLDALARKPAPEPLPVLPSLTMEEVISEIETALNPAAPADLPAAPVTTPAAPGGPRSLPPAPARPEAPPAGVARQAAPLREVRVVSVPAGGFGLIEQGGLVAVALDEAGAGRALAALLTS